MCRPQKDKRDMLTQPAREGTKSFEWHKSKTFFYQSKSQFSYDILSSDSVSGPC